MAPVKETAEEQLLRMIEGPGGPPPVSRRPSRGFSFDRLAEELRAGVTGVWRWALPAQRSGGGADPFLSRLRLAVQVCWVVLAGFGLYLVMDLVFTQRQPPTLASRMKPGGMPELQSETATSSEDHLKTFAEYRDALIARNPFRLVVPETGESTANPRAQNRLAELIGTLTVVGINRGRIPEALIEDTAAQRTSFVKVGDQINGLTVKAIDERGIVVSYEDAETVLK